MKKIFTFISFFVLIKSQAQQIKSYANEFLHIGVDASAMAMANSVVGHADNVYATYWNPAGLVQLEYEHAGLMHASYFANIAQYDYATFAMPLTYKSTLGFSLMRFGVDDILNTTQLIDQNGNVDYQRISKFSTADYALVVSFARRTQIEGLSIGGNAKILHRVIGNFADAWGYGLDFGLQYNSPKNWKLGAMLRDATTTETVWSFNQTEINKIKDAIPGKNQSLPTKNERSLPVLQMGVAKVFSINDKINLLTSAQCNTQFFQTNAIISSKGYSIQPSVGFQVDYKDMVFLRGGFGNFQNQKQIDNSEKLTFQPNIGLGFKYKGISIDYALTDIGNQSSALYSNIFSIHIDFLTFK